MAFEHLTGHRVGPGDDRLDRPLPVVLAKSRSHGRRELFAPVVAIAADQPASAAAEAPCE